MITALSKVKTALAKITGLGSNVSTFLATPSSANLASALTDKTGSGLAVFANSPTTSGMTAKNIVSEVLTTGGGTTAYTLTPSVAIGSYVSGQQFTIKMNAANTGASTIDVSGLGAKSLTKSGATALASNDIVSGAIYDLVYDGTQFQVSGIGGSSATVATQAEVAMGTDNTKMVTPLAAQALGGADGWTPGTGTWTYNAADKINVPSGAASIYQKGDRIKWTQTTIKYGVILAVADTLLTIAVNTDYTVADAAITLNYYSHQANPLGYPTRFLFTSTVTKPTGMTGTAVVGVCSYQITGGLVSITVQAYVDPASGTITGTDFDMSIPLTLIGEANGGNSLATVASVYSNATAFGGTRMAFAVVSTQKTISIRPLAGATWAGATYAYVYCCLNGMLA